MLSKMFDCSVFQCLSVGLSQSKIKQATCQKCKGPIQSKFLHCFLARFGRTMKKRKDLPKIIFSTLFAASWKETPSCSLLFDLMLCWTFHENKHVSLYFMHCVTSLKCGWFLENLSAHLMKSKTSKKEDRLKLSHSSSKTGEVKLVQIWDFWLHYVFRRRWRHHGQL